MKLTDNWCIQGGEELKQWIRKYDQSNPKKINVIGDNYNMFYWIINPSTFTVWTYEDSPQGRTVITVKQLEEMVAEKDLPQRWAVKRTPENAKVINDWFNDRQSYHYCEIYHFMHWPAFTKECYCSNDLADGYTEISFEQFLKITNQEKTMEKKILGYRLIKDFEQYREAAEKICNSPLNLCSKFQRNYNFQDDSPSMTLLKRAGVLDIWFEKVFEEVPKFKVGDYVKVATCQEYEFNMDGKMCNDTHFYKVGKIGVVTKITDDGRWCFIDNNHNGITINQVILATPEEIAAAQKITICGKDVLFDIDFGGENFIKINGQAYLKKELLTLQLLMNRGQIKSLNVGCNGQEQVDLKLIEKILAKL